MRVVILVIGLCIAGALNPEYMTVQGEDGEVFLQVIWIMLIYAFILDLWKKV